MSGEKLIGKIAKVENSNTGCLVKYTIVGIDAYGWYLRDSKTKELIVKPHANPKRIIVEGVENEI